LAFEEGRLRQNGLDWLKEEIVIGAVKRPEEQAWPGFR
jgi:hypothetical protein